MNIIALRTILEFIVDSLKTNDWYAIGPEITKVSKNTYKVKIEVWSSSIDSYLGTIEYDIDITDSTESIFEVITLAIFKFSTQYMELILRMLKNGPSQIVNKPDYVS